MLFPRLRHSSSARRLALIKYAREQIFGYKCGMAGEKEWLKPLKGRDAVNWYWSSKYLLADFNLSHYLYSQADRMCRPKIENPLNKVDSLFTAIRDNREVLEGFMKSIPKDVVEECPTLIDLRDVLKLSKSYPIPSIISDTTHTKEESPGSMAGCARDLGSRRRYIDAMYYRRRLSFLKLIQRKNYKRGKYKEHYLTHPDDKIIWPDNKGVVHKPWPRVY